MSSGYVNLFRKFQQWEWYQDSNTKAVFIELLLTVNYQDRKWRGMVIERGQTATSIPKIAKAVGLSIQNVKTALRKLEQTGELTATSTVKGRVITLCNFDSYNSDKVKSNRQSNRQPPKKANHHDFVDFNHLTQSPKTGTMPTDSFDELNHSESMTCGSDSENANRQLTDKLTDKQPTANRLNLENLTDTEHAETLLEWGQQSADKESPTDTQVADPWSYVKKSTDKLTPNNKSTIINKEEEGPKQKSHQQRPPRMELLWENFGKQESAIPMLFSHPREKQLSESSLQRQADEAPMQKSKQRPNPDPVIPAPKDEVVVRSHPDDLLDWERAAQNGDALGALGFRIAMTPDEINKAVEFLKISNDVFDAWLISRAANDFRTPKGNKPIGTSNWRFDLQGFVRSWKQNETTAAKQRESSGKPLVFSGPRTKEQVENWREIADKLGFEHSDCSRFGELDRDYRQKIMVHPDAKRLA